MNMNTTLTCFIIGQDNLHLQCAKILKEKHHTILGIISLLEASREWAYEQDIPHYFTLEDARAVLSSTEFDYLFSIVNSHILSEDLLARPRHAAINFHDALLPRYAGVNATNWAILNQEKTHGVTWHIATREVDAGDILKQKAVTIEADETAFNLNLKCYEAALELFPELVDELANQTVQRIAQDSDQRTYVGYTHKPESNGWINWNDSAESIMRTFRALQMGEGYPNPLATAKFTVQDQALIIQGMSMTENSSHQSPGTVVSCDESGLQIATSTLDIHITAIKTQLGKSVDWKAFQTRYIQAVAVLASPSQEDGATFQTLSQTYMRHESYWVRSWQAFDPMQIPFLSQKIHTQDGYHYECVSQLPLSDSLRQALKNLLSAEQDFWTLLLTVWSVYLYRVSNYQNFGFLLSRDSDAALHPNLGCFLNSTIPFRVGLEENQTILEAYASVKRALDERQDRAGYLRDIFARYPSLSEVNQPPMLTVLSAAKGEIETSLAGLQADCALVIDPSGDHLSWHVAREYVEADEYLRPILENFAGHLLTMLTAISQNPETALKDLPILTAAEEHKLLVEWNDTATDYPKDKTIHQLFEEQVEKTPDNVAVCFEDQSLTYRELNEKANQLAWCLLEEGVKVGDVVAVCMERGVHLIIAILSTLKAGAAYLPIDPDYPEGRVDFLLKNSSSAAVITSLSETDSVFSKYSHKIKTIESDYRIILFPNREDSEKKLENLAYITYTSGTTGSPKGVMVTHSNVVNMVFSQINMLHINENDRILNFSNLVFDASVWEIFPTLLSGASLYLADKTDLEPGYKLSNFIMEHEITVATLTPSVLSMTPEPTDSQLRVMVSAGEKCSPEIIKRWGEDRVFCNAYGPTEATVCSTLMRYEKNNRFNIENHISIGSPIGNTLVCVMDKNFKLLPIGFSGELWISGLSVSGGYLIESERNQKFLLKKLEKKEAIFYKTGDLVCWLPFGTLEYIARIDRQIKILGCRFELEEIENILLKNKKISMAVAIFVKKESKSQIALFFKCNMKYQMSTEEVKEYLKSFLPHYSIPSRIYEISNFPLTINGKIDKEKLIRIFNSKKTKNLENNESNLSEVEKILFNIFKKILNNSHIGLDDDFFSMGGDSILAMRLINKLNELGFNCYLKDVFQFSTIKKLSKYLKSVKNEIKVNKFIDHGNFSLSPIQKWFFNQNFQHPECFFNSCLIEVKKKETIRIDLLTNCINQVIDHFKELRLGLTGSPPDFLQFYQDDWKRLKIRVIELEKDQDSQNWWEKLSWKLAENFQFGNKPLIEACLVKKESENDKLLIVAHHLNIDGVSWRILLEALDVLYRNSNLSTVLNHKYPRITSYQQWIYELNCYADRIMVEKQLKFWESITEQNNEIPIDFDRGENVEKSSESVKITLNREKTIQLLHQSGSFYNASVGEILLALLSKTLHMWNENSGVMIDVESHGREEFKKEINLINTIGWFTELFPVFIKLNSQEIECTRSLISSVKKKFSEISSQGICYGLLKYFKKIKFKNTPKISFNYWGQFDGLFQSENFQIKELSLFSHPENSRSYLISIDIIVKQQQLCITWTYSHHYHKRETIEKLANSFLIDINNLFNLSNKNDFLEQKIAQFSMVNPNTLEYIDSRYGLENVDQVYPLALLQDGLLFHSMQPKTVGAYVVQLLWSTPLEVPLSLNNFQKSFNSIISKHEVLRSRFLWENIEQPVQLIQKKVVLPWVVYDWTMLESEVIHQRFSDFLKADRDSGFSFNENCLARVTIFQLPKNQYSVVFTIHHILLDGWSLPIFLNELEQYYHDYQSNQFCEKTEPDNYKKYINWLKNKDQKSAKIFWKKYLEGFESPTKLSMIDSQNELDRSDTKIDIMGNSWYLTNKTSQDISNYAREHHVTLNSIFQCLWGLLLKHYSQTEDIVFGVTVTTRNANIVGSDEIMGLLINTVPMRIHYKEDLLTCECLSQIQLNFSEVMHYNHVSLLDIHKCSQISNESYLFDTILVVENYPIYSEKSKLFKFEDIKIIESTHYPLTCIIVPGENILVKISYDKNKVKKLNVDRIQSHFNNLLSEILKNPKKSICHLSLMSLSEKNLLLQWGNSQKIKISEKALPQLIEEQVIKNPNNTAVLFEDESLTYSELNKTANRMANFLKKSGIKPGMIVAVCLDRGIKALVSIIAVLKLGAAYLPIDPDYPKSRIIYVIKDSGTLHLLTNKKISDTLYGENLKKLKIILLEERLSFSKECDNNLDPVPIDNLAYIIYTSGSTGNPKGVLVTHQNASQLFCSVKNLFDFNSSDVWSFLHNFNFDFSIWEIFGALSMGATLFIVSSYLQKDFFKFYNWVSEKKITILSTTPAVFYQLISVDKILNKKLELKYVFFGGESLSISMLKPWFDKHGYEIPKLINMYGITETTVHTTYYPLENKKFIESENSIIGKPLPGRSVYILDKFLMPVPIGVTGELYVGGAGVAQGYLNNPDLTSQKFTRDFFSNNSNSRLYRSGDLAKWLDDGSLNYEGRLDNQIKIRGFRVELGEIQAKIEQYDGVKQALVVTSCGSKQDIFIAAYLVTENLQLDLNLLRAYLVEHLPSYMIPSAFVFLDAIPLTPNGKVDRKSLPDPNQGQRVQKLYKEPKSLEEKLIASIWSNHLNISLIGINDDFFELGGDSFSVLKVLSSIEEKFHTHIYLKQFISNPTISGLAELILRSKAEKSALLAATSERVSYHCLVNLKPEGNKEPLFLIHPIGGTVFWYISLVKYLDPDRPVYGIQDPGLEITPIPYKNVEELALYYLKVIKSVQPKGSYFLAGASAGATISVEIAHQLEMNGEEISFIGLLDGWAPFPEGLHNQAYFEANMRRQYYTMHHQFSTKGIKQAESLLQLQWCRSRMIADYKVPLLDSKLTLFKAQDTMEVFKSIDETHNHWRSYSTQPVDLYIVPGNHETMFEEPNVSELAKKINQPLIELSQAVIS